MLFLRKCETHYNLRMFLLRDIISRMDEGEEVREGGEAE